MTYLATFNWGWLLASGILGLLMGWIAVVQRGEGWSVVTLRKFVVLIAGLVLTSAFHLLPGRFGYWLDLGLAMLAVYVVGCVIGSWLRNLVVSRPAPRAEA